MNDRDGTHDAVGREAVTALLRDLDALSRVNAVRQPFPVYKPIDLDDPELTAQDGLRPHLVELQLSVPQKIARAAVVGVFIVLAAACGVVLA